MNGKSTRLTTRCALCVVAPLVVAFPAGAQSPEPAPGCQVCPCIICIAPRKVMTIDTSLTANCVHVETGGTLTIAGNGRLTLTGPEPSCLHGNLYLRPQGDAVSPVLAFAITDHTITGSGKIKGESDLAGIEIASRVTLINQGRITGYLRITGPGRFLNEGSVTADGWGTLDIDVSGGVDDNVRARWEVIAPDASLRFLEQPGCLEGNFTVTAGTLSAGSGVGDDDIDVVTTGRLTQTGGSVVAGVDDSFTFNAPRCPE